MNFNALKKMQETQNAMTVQEKKLVMNFMHRGLKYSLDVFKGTLEIEDGHLILIFNDMDSDKSTNRVIVISKWDESQTDSILKKVRKEFGG